MRSSRVFHAVDSHTEGMPTRVITGGVGRDPRCDDERAAAALHRASRPHPATAHERAARALVDVAARSCSRRPDPTATSASSTSRSVGCLPMCGHGTIGVATVLVETGMVEVTEPRHHIRLDTPAGLVVADVEVA